MPSPDSLLAELGVADTAGELFETALTHRSYLHEHWTEQRESNERLEFLGDSILNFLAAQYLYTTFPDHNEGQLTALRSALVRTSTLARWARQINLGAYMRLGKGEERSGGRDREPLLADAFEAVLAAIFISQGLSIAEQILRPLLVAESERVVSQGLVLDHKSRLQERMQGAHNETPRYETTNITGPDHDRRITVEVWSGDRLLGVGEGHSKQAAAQTAAREALSNLSVPPTTEEQ
ncbi:MAG: ribonuclease III [Herpetosiphon sp.]